MRFAQTSKVSLVGMFVSLAGVFVTPAVMSDIPSQIIREASFPPRLNAYFTTYVRLTPEERRSLRPARGGRFRFTKRIGDQPQLGDLPHSGSPTKTWPH